MTKYLSDCHGAEVAKLSGYTSCVTSKGTISTTNYCCLECNTPCTIHEVKEEPKSEYEFYKRQLDKMKQKKEVKEEPVKEELNKDMVAWIENRIMNEYNKHKTFDWAKIASIKIVRQLKEHPPISEGEVSEDKLREAFKKETGTNWENSQGEPDIDYVQWLERGTAKLREEIGEYKKTVHHLMNVGNSIQGELEKAEQEISSLKSQLNELKK